MSLLPEKIKTYLTKHPKMRVKDVAEHFNVHVSYIYALRRRLHEVPEDPTPGPTLEHDAAVHASSAIKQAKRLFVPAAAVQIAKKKGVSLQAYVKEIRETDPTAFEETNVDTVLDSRAKDYGKFIEGAEIMQMLKRLVHNYIEDRGTPLAFDQREAIDMIIHKLGRIINGNPDKVDHWVDIAGYSTLVADRLQGDVR